jgi:hypothetical protein
MKFRFLSAIGAVAVAAFFAGTLWANKDAKPTLESRIFTAAEGNCTYMRWPDGIGPKSVTHRPPAPVNV